MNAKISAVMGFLTLMSTAAGAVQTKHRLPTFALSGADINPRQMSFLPHVGPGMYDNYVVVDLPYAPVRGLLRSVEKAFDVKLLSRGEAHITVLTPPEYWKVGRHLPISQINDLIATQVQQIRFDSLCLGRGRATIDGKEESTFFVVVRSPDLVRLRYEIQKAFLTAGGAASDFDPEEFFPHITVGFTKRDIHIDAGVIKDVRSCVANIVSTSI